MRVAVSSGAPVMPVGTIREITSETLFLLEMVAFSGDDKTDVSENDAPTTFLEDSEPDSFPTYFPALFPFWALGQGHPSQNWRVESKPRL